MLNFVNILYFSVFLSTHYGMITFPFISVKYSKRSILHYPTKKKSYKIKSVKLKSVHTFIFIPQFCLMLYIPRSGNVRWHGIYTTSLHAWPPFRTWFNFNPSRDVGLHPSFGVGWIYLSIVKLQRCIRESLWMDKKFISHITGHVITYLNWDQS